MARMIFVNIPVTDLTRSITFYEAVGFQRDDRFCDDDAQMMVLSDTISVMLLTHARFNSFTPKTIADTRTTAQALFCVSAGSRAAVTAMVDQAVAAGGTPDPTPQQDVDGFMFGRSFEDPDGHIWEVMWMDVAAAKAAMAPQAEIA